MGHGSIKLYEPLSKHTTMRVGGPAQFWAEPEGSEEGVCAAGALLHAQRDSAFRHGPWSDLLVRDGGIRGVVVHLSRGEFKKVEVRDGKIHAGVGVKQKELAYAAPTSGKAYVFEIESSADPAAIHRRLGYLPGEFALYDRLTGGQTLEYFGNLRGGVDRAYRPS